jgi:hypothetical protein
VSKDVVKKNISFDDYKNCVLNDTPKRVKINAIRTLKLTNYSLTQDKLAFSNKDEVWFVMEMKNIIKNQERVIEEMILEQLYPKKEKRRSKRLDRNELALIKLFL